MSSSKSKSKQPSTTTLAPKSLDYINPKLGSMYFRFHPTEGLRYAVSNAFLAWKDLPSIQSATSNRPFFIFIHDYGSSARIFNKVVSKISHYCLAVDLKGWGRSDDTKDEAARAYSCNEMKNEIVRIVNLLEGEKFILVGHGMGAKVAQLYASQQPADGLLGLVLLAPAPLSRWRPSAEIMDKYRAAYCKEGRRVNAVESFVRNTLASRPIDGTDLRNLVEDGVKDSALAKEAWLTYGMDEDFSHRSRQIKVPVVVRVGEEDKVISRAEVEREICNKLNLCVPLKADNCGHLIPLEDEELPKALSMFSEDAEFLKAGMALADRARREGKRPEK